MGGGWSAASIRDRLLKKAHLPRCHTRALVAAYPQYASLGATRGALLDLFEQPGKNKFFSNLLDTVERVPALRSARPPQAPAGGLGVGTTVIAPGLTAWGICVLAGR
jgi:hypothetical protein